jgi:hypothetical protein
LVYEVIRREREDSPFLPYGMLVKWSWASVIPSSLQEVLGSTHKERYCGFDEYKNLAGKN